MDLRNILIRSPVENFILAMIAENFYYNEFNIFYTPVNWAGDNPAYVGPRVSDLRFRRVIVLWLRWSRRLQCNSLLGSTTLILIPATHEYGRHYLKPLCKRPVLTRAATRVPPTFRRIAKNFVFWCCTLKLIAPGSL